MRWNAWLVAACALVAGCVMTGRAPQLAAMDGVTYDKDQYGQEFVAAIAFNFPAPANLKPDALPLCIAKTVDNGSVNLSDSSRSWVGPYSGYYYKAGVQREAGGGEVLKFVSNDKSEVVAEGTVTHRYTFGMAPIERAVRFTLNASVNANGTVLKFDRLEEAQLDTGVVPNDGYGRVGAWEQARPELVAESLKSVAERLNACLAQ